MYRIICIFVISVLSKVKSGLIKYKYILLETDGLYPALIFKILLKNLLFFFSNIRYILM